MGRARRLEAVVAAMLAHLLVARVQQYGCVVLLSSRASAATPRGRLASSGRWRRADMGLRPLLCRRTRATLTCSGLDSE